MSFVGLMAAAVSVFVYGEGRGEGFFRNDGLQLVLQRLRSLLRGIFGKIEFHWNRRIWYLVRPKVLHDLSQVDVECFGWQVEMVR